MLIQGTSKWLKLLGEPGWGYEKAFKEWSVDVYIDEATVQRLKAENLGPSIKEKGDGPYVSFKRKALKADGTPNSPVRIVDHKGQPWDGRKIGNGSTVNVNFAINEYKPGKFALNILSLQVWNLVPYDGGEFPTREDSDEDTGAEDWSKEVA